jgi:hypothetical protein
MAQSPFGGAALNVHLFFCKRFGFLWLKGNAPQNCFCHDRGCSQPWVKVGSSQDICSGMVAAKFVLFSDFRGQWQ